jgi:hypothetical protein
MTFSRFTSALAVLSEGVKALEDLRIEYHSKRLTGEQRARVKSVLGTLSREIMVTASLLDGRESVPPAPGDPTCPYGWCPLCGSPGDSREKRPGGNDICSAGHLYPSSSAVMRRG